VLPEKTRKRIIGEYKRGLSMESVAEKFSISQGVVRRYLLEEGISPRALGETLKANRPRNLKSRYLAGESCEEIAMDCGLHPTTVTKWIKDLGIARQRGETKRLRTANKNANTKSRAISFYENSAGSVQQVADQLGLSLTTVWKWLKDAGVIQRTKLSDTARPFIARARKDGWTWNQIADDLGVTTKTVRKFCGGGHE
jgi:transposase-like protein